jgi:hypothetical protein
LAWPNAPAIVCQTRQQLLLVERRRSMALRQPLTLVRLARRRPLLQQQQQVRAKLSQSLPGEPLAKQQQQVWLHWMRRHLVPGWAWPQRWASRPGLALAWQLHWALEQALALQLALLLPESLVLQARHYPPDLADAQSGWASRAGSDSHQLTARHPERRPSAEPSMLPRRLLRPVSALWIWLNSLAAFTFDP